MSQSEYEFWGYATAPETAAELESRARLKGSSVPLTFGSLFAGIGGFDLGFEQAGMQCKWQVEIDPYCRRVLAKHWPNVRRWDDVRTFPPTGDWGVDCIIGGFPCTQVSTAAAISGNRSGLAGPDSGLWFEMLRIIKAIGPGRVIVENVAGVKTYQATIQGGLEGAGYAVRKINQSAFDVGAPHLRRRVFFVADINRERLAVTWQGGPSATTGIARRSSNRNTWLSALAGVSRVADGLPSGLERRERIKACGNAVCPPVARWIAERILAAHNQI